MRYSIMLQLVTTISVIFVAAAALFAWFQNRQMNSSQESVEKREFRLVADISNQEEWFI